MAADPARPRRGRERADDGAPSESLNRDPERNPPFGPGGPGAGPGLDGTRGAAIGLGLALATATILALLPHAWARGATANLLTLIAAIYVGFSLASGGRLGLVKQAAGCAFFVVLALLGLWVSWWFLVAGLALHGGWDWLHHGERGKETVPGWYVPFCAVYDWTLAILVAVFFAGPPFG